MDITYLGHSSFKLRGKSATLVTDPYDASVGLKFPKHTEADIVTVSHTHEDHNATGQIEGNPRIIAGPGEYEVKGVGIIGLPTYHDADKGTKRGRNTVYRVDMDNISVVHLGDLGHALTQTDLEELGSVDVLLVPCGGFYTIDAATAAKLVGEIEPAIVIPMHFKTSQHDTKVFGNLTGVDVFLKELGANGIVPIPKLTLTRDKLPEQMQVVVLE